MAARTGFIKDTNCGNIDKQFYEGAAFLFTVETFPPCNWLVVASNTDPRIPCCGIKEMRFVPIYRVAIWLDLLSPSGTFLAYGCHLQNVIDNCGIRYMSRRPCGWGVLLRRPVFHFQSPKCEASFSVQFQRAPVTVAFEYVTAAVVSAKARTHYSHKFFQAKEYSTFKNQQWAINSACTLSCFSLNGNGISLQMLAHRKVRCRAMQAIFTKNSNQTSSLASVSEVLDRKKKKKVRRVYSKAISFKVGGHSNVLFF